MTTIYRTMTTIYRMKKRITLELHAGAEVTEVIAEMIVLALQEKATVEATFNGTPIVVDHATIVGPYLDRWTQARKAISP